MARAHGGMEAIRCREIRRPASHAMPLRLDPPVLPEPASPGADKRLWLGLAAGFAIIFFLALLVQWLVPATLRPPPAPGGPSAPGAANKGALNSNAPLMTRPQLLDNQQAMPELIDVDARTPAANLSGGGAPLGVPGPPSSLGTGALGQ
ncbi:MAG: hypothetical protein VKO26_05905 [Cyanobacteriota bacterium]|nr:hypothetical protein [Cyanobacteriota bacterium]